MTINTGQSEHPTRRVANKPPGSADVDKWLGRKAQSLSTSTLQSVRSCLI